MFSPVVSVICPVYNTEKVLGKCIRSVLEQDFKAIEVILVNDGSTDGSLRICQKYAARDERIILIDKPNGGRIQARKDGLLRAQGEYVFFIDCDDYLEKNALSTLVEIAGRHHLDMVAGNHDTVYDNWGLVSKKAVPFDVANTVISKDEWIEILLKLDQRGNNSGGVFMWGRIYRRSCILEAMRCDEAMLFPTSKDSLVEDLSFNLALAQHLQSCWLANEVIYHYRYGGASSRFFPFASKGGYYFNYRYRLCMSMQRQDLLPDVLLHYIRVYGWELVGRLHYQPGSLDGILQFVDREYHDREILSWARLHQSKIGQRWRGHVLMSAVVNHKVDEIIHYARQREAFLQKHYRKMKMVGLYQKIMDYCSFLVG